MGATVGQQHRVGLRKALGESCATERCDGGGLQAPHLRPSVSLKAHRAQRAREAGICASAYMSVVAAAWQQHRHKRHDAKRVSGFEHTAAPASRQAAEAVVRCFTPARERAVRPRARLDPLAAARGPPLADAQTNRRGIADE
jgi:hypothetical protein